MRCGRLSHPFLTKMEIDVDKVLRLRAPGYYRFIPRAAVKWLERFIRQADLNTLLHHNEHLTGSDFAEGVIRDLDVHYKLAGEKIDPSNHRVILISNHPLGGVDGLVLSAAIRRIYGLETDELKFVVNDLLTFVEPLRSIFIGVNKHGAQSRESAKLLDEAFDGDMPIVMFPAGLCSRLGDDGRIADLKWNKMVVSKAIFSRRDIIPMHFEGRNSSFFYKFARLRTRLGLKFNLEMLRLPAEIFGVKGSTFTITAGRPVAWQSLRGGKEAQSQADALRDTVYSLVR